ncbi:MAG TPA: glycosyltransferase family 2 protein [Bryobacteraceae bacterium]|jgi:glycosyltransferase involved in cell wall biosynthesis|nr:glycosyltransferase family 2 protein [Bryobacteraceae bacterium]
MTGAPANAETGQPFGSRPPRLSVVVPCYNEEAVIGECSRRLRQVIGGLVDGGKIAGDSQIVFVNDGSRDRTWEMIQELSASDPVFSGICLSRNFGHQGALLAGLHSAPGDALISIDADLQDDVTVIEKMVDSFARGFDVVYGVRKERKNDTFFKRTTALTFYRIMQALGTRTIYNHADFRLMSRRAIEALKEYGEVSLFLRGIVPLVGFPSTSVFFDRAERFAGETKYPVRKMIELSLAAITSFSSTPLRLITFTAAFGVISSMAVAAWVLFVTLFLRVAVPGWASILLPVLFIGSLNLLATGVIGEYLARVFDEVKARPRYLIASVVNLGAARSSAAFAGTPADRAADAGIAALL